MAAVACGAWHSLALSRSGDVYGWGWNRQGQLGGVTVGGGGGAATLVPVPRLLRVGVGVGVEEEEDVEFAQVRAASPRLPIHAPAAVALVFMSVGHTSMITHPITYLHTYIRTTDRRRRALLCGPGAKRAGVRVGHAGARPR